MKLSVIVPVYNGAAFLRPCLDSLLNQTLDDYEILAVNDGSRDGSGAILEEYRRRAPEKLRVLTTENGGQGRARNLALDLARGDWLGFADSDDWVSPDMFEKLWRAGEESGADLVLCDAEERWPDGRRVYMPLRISSCAAARWGTCAFPRGSGMRTWAMWSWRCCARISSPSSPRRCIVTAAATAPP